MFTLVAAPSLLFFCLALFVPESPRWLVKNGQDESGRRVLARIGGEAYAALETAGIKATLATEEIARVRFANLLEPRVLRVLVIGCALAVLQQWSGINVLFNYAENIFKQAGFGVSTILLFIVITGLVNTAFTFIALATVDRWGRRSLMLAGCAGIAASHLLIGFAYLFKLRGWPCSSFPRGHRLLRHVPGPDNLGADLRNLPQPHPRRRHLRGGFRALDCLFHPHLHLPAPRTAIGTGKTFWLYSAICLAGFVFVYFHVPETKGKSLEQIENESAGRE